MNTASAVELPELTKKAFSVQAQALHEYSISNVIDITRFSCYYRLLRVTARILAICKGERRSGVDPAAAQASNLPSVR